MRIGKTLMTLLAGGMLCSTMAHDFWVIGKNKDKFSAVIGYGHDFPKPEAIPQDRVKLFNPLYILDKNGKKELKQVGENYQFEGDKLAKGSYVLAGEYKPTFWTKDSDNKWHMDGTKDSVKDTQYCQMAVMNAKEIIVIDGAKEDFVFKPIGHKIEIVPIDNIFKVDEPFKVQVFVDKKPLKTANVVGTFEGFLQDKHAFSGTTDLNGMIEVMALREGRWMLEVMVDRPYADKSKCDDETLIATLTFEVKK